VASGALLIAVVLVTAVAANAAELPDTTGNRAPDVGSFANRKVGEIMLAGVPDDLRSPLRSGLALAPRQKLLSTEKARLRQAQLEADLKRIRLYLARHGYPEATATAQVVALEQGSDVRVVFTVELGPRVAYREVRLEGFPEDVLGRARTLREERLAGDKRFDQSKLERLRAQFHTLLQNAGYARPEVTLEVERVAADRADITYSVDPGRRFYFGETTVTGLPEDLAPVARRAIGIDPGTPYSLDRLNEAERDLRRLNLLRTIGIEAQKSAPDTLDLTADLSVRNLQAVELSVGTWTDEWIRVRASWIHRNLFKGGRGFELGGAYSPHLRDAYTRLWWPALLSSDSRLELKLSYQLQDEDNYKQDIYEAELANVFSPSEEVSVRLGVAFTDGQIDLLTTDPGVDVEEVGLATVLRGRIYYDGADNVINPSRGTRLGLQAEYSPAGVLSENPFVSVRTDGVRYLPLTEKTVLAARLDLGTAWPLGEAESLLPNRRFFAGGASTMRGYKRRRLGPVDATGEPVGGEARLLAGVELRQELFWVFSGSAFFDAGQVWRKIDEVNARGIVGAAGLGLLLRTPVGPLRVNVARNLSRPEHGDPWTVFHFAVGHPF
jgi:outer membrane protein assembly complex protein YaeT